mgnify:CR=1 FL=1
MIHATGNHEAGPCHRHQPHGAQDGRRHALANWDDYMAMATRIVGRFHTQFDLRFFDYVHPERLQKKVPLRFRKPYSVRVAYTAGEAVGPEIFNFFRAIGVNMKQLYGQTEASVFVTIHPNGEVFSDTVGKPVSQVELRIADSGEVLYRSPGVFKEYFKNPEATNDTKTADGWVHTGDAGYLDERGHLRIIDRAKDVGKLRDGTLFAPKFIENKLKFFPHINEAVAFGDGRDFVTALVNIDMTAVGDWAERRNIAYASYQELAAHPAVGELIQGEIAQVNADLAADPRMAGAQIRRFLILHKALDADDGELTRTNKVRRGFIGERYRTLIDALYSTAQEAFIKVDVTFEDGRKGTIEGTMTIRDLDIRPAAPLRKAG